MFEFLQLFQPTTAEILGVCAVLLAVLALSGLGSLGAGRWRLNEADCMVGIGMTAAAMTLLGALAVIPLSLIGYAILAIGMIGLAWRTLTDGLVGGPGSGKVIVLMLPLLLLLAGMQASQWDEFSQWLHSARFLIEHDFFPRDGLPASRASYPAYPYGLADLTLIVSLVSRQFQENATILINAFLMGAFGLVLLRVAEIAGGRHSRPDERGWGPAAYALIAGILTFPVQKILFSGYADAATAFLLGATAICGWRSIEALEHGAPARSRSPALQFGWIMAALVALKQANLVLFVIVTIAVLFTGLITAGVRAGPLLRNAVLMVLPGAATFAVWRAYVDLYLPGAGEFTFFNEANWVFHLAPEILAKMAEIAAKKGVYFGIMLITVVLGLRGMIRRKSPFDRLALICALVFLGYNSFLFVAYLTAFGEYEARNAASYWRYNMHLFGIAAAPVAWFAGTWASDRFAATGKSVCAIVATALVIALPLGFADKIRFDTHPVKDFIRDIAGDLRTTLPDGTRLMPVDPLMTRFYGLVLNYELTDKAEVGGYVHIRNPSTRDMQYWVDRFDPRHMFVHTVTDDVDRLIDQALDRKAAHLLVRRDGGWDLVRSWPYPGYDSPTEFKN
jgi:hypothetical protein